MYTYTFNVTTLQAGQLRKYGDSFYTYEVSSSLNEHTVKNFCMNVLQHAFEKEDMPNAFAGEVLEFKKLTENNKGKKWNEPMVDEIYSYKVRSLYTD